MRNGIYVVSKVRHAAVWKDLRERGYPVISTWIDDGLEHEIDFSEAWPRYIQEASRASFVIAYALPDEVLKGGLIEIGAALGNGAYVFVVGEINALRTVRYHPRVKTATSVAHALALIGEFGGAQIGNRRQQTTANWVGNAFGTACLYDMRERGRRVYEEAAELAQALNVPREELTRIADHVYSKPPGVVEQEIAGVGVSLLATSSAWGVSFDDVLDTEIERVHTLPIEHFRQKKAVKVAAGISMPNRTGTVEERLVKLNARLADGGPCEGHDSRSQFGCRLDKGHAGDCTDDKWVWENASLKPL